MHPDTVSAATAASATTTIAVRQPRPRAGWRQIGRDLGYLLPGLPIAVLSFTLLAVGSGLGIGLTPLALLGLFILAGTLLLARAFATAERARISMLEDRPVGPVRYAGGPTVYAGDPSLTDFEPALADVDPARAGRPGRRGPLSVVARWLSGRQLWRDFAHGLVILPVRVFTWSIAVTWTSAALMVTYPLWAWSLPRGDVNGLAELLFGWPGTTADVLFNTALAVPFVLTLPYVVRGMALIESSLGWGLLTSETDVLRARAERLHRSRQSAIDAEADNLRRVERDLHDGPQQRLVRLAMDLKTAQRRLGDDPAAAGPLIEAALAQSEDALAELRTLSRGIAPPILTDRGLPAALAAATARCPIPTSLDVRLADGQRLPAAVENAGYFVVTEALANAAKHSGASRCDVSVFLSGAALNVLVRDDGQGGAHPGKGHGLTGLADRLAAVDGRFTVDSPPGAGTTVAATIPTAR